MKKNVLQTVELEKAWDSSGLNWVAEKYPVQTESLIPCTEYKAVVRGDTKKVLSIMGNGYTPFQNSEVFAFANEIIKQGGFMFEDVLIFRDGEKTILRLKYGEPVEIASGDFITVNLNIINSFDGSYKLSVLYIPERGGCKNQLVGKFSNQVRIKHTIGIQNRAQIALDVIASLKDAHDAFVATARRLTLRLIEGTMVEDFLDKLLGKHIGADGEETSRLKNQKGDIKVLINSGTGNHGKNVWDIYNGVVEYIDHHYGDNEEKRSYSAAFGTGFAIKEKAWDLAVALASDEEEINQ